MRTYQMEKDVSFSYMLASFALLIPFPGRLAYGIILIILLNIQMLTVPFFRNLVEFLKLDDLLSVLTAVMLLCESIVFNQLLSLYSPLMALTLSFVIYLPAVSSFIISHLYPLDPSIDRLGELRNNMKYSLTFSVFAFIFFLIRDIIGYGTITFPGRKELVCISLPALDEGIHVGVFLASIPGAVLLVFITFFLIWQISKKIDSVGGISDGTVA